jgi:hypothetical protein
MKSLCDLFNRYRDGTLDQEQKHQFESHLAACEECRTRLILLHNLVHFIRNQEIMDTAGPSEQIADRAYEHSDAWDSRFLCWLKPAHALCGMAVLLIFVSFLWVGSLTQQPAAANDYELLFTGGDQSVGTVANLPDAEFESWLEQGVNAK